jgi:hypothetical protein
MEASGQFYATAALPPEKETLSTHYIGGCLGSRAGLDSLEKREIFCLCRELNPDSSVI